MENKTTSIKPVSIHPDLEARVDTSGLNLQQMKLASRLPTSDKLAWALTSMRLPEKLGTSSLQIVARQRVLYASSNSSEIVVVETPNQATIRLYIKYDYEDRPPSFGHRGGCRLEGLIYDRLLESLDLPTAKLYGTVEDPDSASTWLVIQCIDGYRLNQTQYGAAEGPKPLFRAAEWIARFHRRFEGCETPYNGIDLPRYDEQYLVSWVKRTAEFSRVHERQFPWLKSLYEPASKRLAELADLPNTLIHGEYTVHNVLDIGGTSIPIDWESVAVAPGVIDLVGISENWDEDVVAQCIDTYCEHRWGIDRPSDFDERLEMAKLYYAFRWLGNRRDRTEAGVEKIMWRFDSLHETAKTLQLL